MAAQPIVALVLDGAGGARRLDGDQIDRWTPEQGQPWVQLDPASSEAGRWLAEASGLSAADQETLMRPSSQTRVEVLEDSTLILSVRTFAHDGAQTRQVRGWLRPDRLITSSSDDLPALASCVSRLAAGNGPRGVADILWAAMHAGALQDQIAMTALDEKVLELEELSDRDIGQLPPMLREAQHRGIALRRRLAAHRESLLQLKQSGPAWLMAPRRDEWRSAFTTCNDLADTTDGLLDRLRGLQDYVQNRLSTVLNDRLYLLTVLSAIVMPLSFVTGLLGVNVGGIPARDTAWGFALLCLLLIALGAAEYLLLRKLRWVPNPPPPKDPFRQVMRTRAAAWATGQSNVG
jgi:zinc transporter